MKPSTKWTSIGSISGIVVGLLTEFLVAGSIGERMTFEHRVDSIDRLLSGMFFGIGIGAVVGVLIGGVFQGRVAPWREICAGMLIAGTVGALQWVFLDRMGGFFIGGAAGALLGHWAGKDRERPGP